MEHCFMLTDLSKDESVLFTREEIDLMKTGLLMAGQKFGEEGSASLSARCSAAWAKLTDLYHTESED